MNSDILREVGLRSYGISMPSFFRMTSPLPEVSEDRLRVFASHGMSEITARQVTKVVTENLVLMKELGVPQQYVEKYMRTTGNLPRDLFCALNCESPTGLDVIIQCDNCHVGKGTFMTYVKALEYFSLTTYATSTTDEESGSNLANVHKLVEKSPHIVRLHYVHTFPFRNKMALWFEYLELGDLEEWRASGKPLSERDVQHISLDVASALVDLHNHRVIQKDLKPPNVLLYYDEGGHLRAKLADLGLAEASEGYEPSGSPRGLPPEFWALYPQSDFVKYHVLDSYKVEIWAFGDLVHWLLKNDYFIPDDRLGEIVRESNEKGIPCFQGLKLEFEWHVRYPEVNSTEPESLDKLMRQMLQEHPEDRPQSMNVIRSRIAKIIKNPLPVKGSVAEMRDRFELLS